MGRTKGIIHVDITQARKLVSESRNGLWFALDLLSFFVLDGALFFWVESHVFTKKNLSLRPVNLVNHSFSNTIIKEGNRPAEILLEVRHHRPQGMFLNLLAIGPSEMG